MPTGVLLPVLCPDFLNVTPPPLHKPYTSVLTTELPHQRKGETATLAGKISSFLIATDTLNVNPFSIIKSLTLRRTQCSSYSTGFIKYRLLE